MSDLENLIPRGKIRTCEHCGTRRVTMPRCDCCKGAFYCNKICQQRHYMDHKTKCEKEKNKKKAKANQRKRVLAAFEKLVSALLCSCHPAKSLLLELPSSQVFDVASFLNCGDANSFFLTCKTVRALCKGSLINAAQFWRCSRHDKGCRSQSYRRCWRIHDGKGSHLAIQQLCSSCQCKMEVPQKESLKCWECNELVPLPSGLEAGQLLCNSCDYFWRERVECFDCPRVCCNQHSTKCAECDAIFCSHDLSECDDCGKLACDNCQFAFCEGGHCYCSSCDKIRICDSCLMPWCEDCRFVRYCNYCDRNLCDQCENLYCCVNCGNRSCGACGFVAYCDECRDTFCVDKKVAKVGRSCNGCRCENCSEEYEMCGMCGEDFCCECASDNLVFCFENDCLMCKENHEQHCK